nr:reverse transcriptase domain-containing protein [Tanacetum cinerariifolium]
MCTRPFSNLPIESPPNPTTSIPKLRNSRRSKQPFILEESPIDMMADQRTMAELLRAPTKGYAEAIVVPLILAEQFELKHSLINMMTTDQFFGLEKDNPHDHICMVSIQNLLRACPYHGFTELHQPNTFYNALNPVDQDSLNSAAGGNLLERRTQDVLTIIENKSKIRNSRNKSIVSQVKSSDANSSSSSEIAKLTHAVNQQTSTVTTTMTAILKQFPATPPPASVKSVKEICVTCGGAHLYYQCLAADGNTLPELQDNIQGYVSAAAVNYNQALLSNKEKLLELANTPLNENCSSVILKKLPEKLGDPGKFLILCGFSELVSSSARVPLIVGRPFLQTARALIDVHKEEMILRDDDERLTLNMRHDTSSYSNQPQKESINMINIYDDSRKLTSVVMKDNLAEQRVHVPNVLTTHPTLMLDSDFIPSDNSLPEYEIFYFDIEEMNSGSTTIHVDISLSDLECFNSKDKPDPG